MSAADNNFVSEINVTPFVDVMLVLLVIFMITAPMMSEGLEVELPPAPAAAALPAEKERLVLTIKADGALFLDQYETSVDDLAAALQSRTRGRQLLVRADRNVLYGTVMEVMSRIREAGVGNVGLVTIPAVLPGGQESGGMITAESRP